jgi:hypothetical protein
MEKMEINGFSFVKLGDTNDADTRDMAEETTWTWSKDATSDATGDSEFCEILLPTESIRPTESLLPADWSDSTCIGIDCPILSNPNESGDWILI